MEIEDRRHRAPRRRRSGLIGNSSEQHRFAGRMSIDGQGVGNRDIEQAVASDIDLAPRDPNDVKSSGPSLIWSPNETGHHVGNSFIMAGPQMPAGDRAAASFPCHAGNQGP